MKKLILTLMLVSSAVIADWFYDNKESFAALANDLLVSLVQSTPSVILLYAE
jgi:phage-related minor tail protein